MTSSLPYPIDDNLSVKATKHQQAKQHCPQQHEKKTTQTNQNQWKTKEQTSTQEQKQTRKTKQQQQPKNKQIQTNLLV